MSPYLFFSLDFQHHLGIGFVAFFRSGVNFYRYDGKDPGYIVIDELAGICVTFADLCSPWQAEDYSYRHAIGFVLFRFLTL